MRPKAKLTKEMLHGLMSHHFDGTWFDPARDVDSYCGLSHEAVVKLWPVAECSAR